ncbi:rhodanese-like domain-containing protein [Kineococcus glutinatus]|uniref:Rhodanese-like domain-containing protein n=1 Tax=Kineococcus glutinatus TaxID=1070872 RepID=A0ABP9HKU4_9ACTN
MTAPAPSVGTRARPGIADVLARARARLDRLTPVQAHAEQAAGALLVDIRPMAQRLTEGEVPGALVLERNVLEWRLDPTSGAAIPGADHDLRVIVLCQEGYTSSLAAAALQDVGVHRATDVVGGLAAWRDGGLPVVRGWTPAGEVVSATAPAPQG